MLRSLLIAFLFISALLFVGCGDGSYHSGEYIDPDEPTPVGDYYSDTDLKIATESMFQSLTAVNEIADASTPPVLLIMQMENHTRDLVDMEALSNKLTTALIKTGSVRIINKKLRSGLEEEYDYNASGIVDLETAKLRGRQVGADYVLSGEFTSIEMPRKREKRVYYRLTLRLTNLSTNLIIWQDEKEIKKLLKK